MKQKTEHLLCISFMELLRKYPFPKITIQKIANQCGVNRQTFYYHYDNIYDLMSNAFEYELVYECKIYEADTWETVLIRLMIWMKNNRIIIKNILTNADVHYFRRSIYQVIEKCFTSRSWFDSMSNVPQNIDTKCLVKFLTLAMTQYLVEWAEADFKEPMEDIISHFLFILKRVFYCETEGKGRSENND